MHGDFQWQEREMGLSSLFLRGLGCSEVKVFWLLGELIDDRHRLVLYHFAGRVEFG